MNQGSMRTQRSAFFQIRDIEEILKNDEETKNPSNKLGPIEREELKKSLNMLIKTREEIIRKDKQIRVEKAIQLAKKTNEKLLNALKPVFAEAVENKNEKKIIIDSSFQENNEVKINKVKPIKTESKDEITEFKNEITEINNSIKKLEREFILFKQNKNYTMDHDEKIDFHNYLPIGQKPSTRSFEVYDIVVNYFTFMAKTFGNNRLRDIHNTLLIEYGENLIQNSFETYYEFMKDETIEDMNILKIKLVELQENNKKNSNNLYE